MCKECGVRRDMSLLGFGDFVHLPGCSQQSKVNGYKVVPIPVRPAKGWDEAIKSMRKALGVE